jgi:Na+-driven multidrug efflux pump
VHASLQGLCLQISAMAYMASMAYSSAVNTRIGNELGAGDAVTARIAFIIGVAAVILVQACIMLGLFFGARQVLSLLTNNKEVDDLARKVFPLLLPTFIGETAGGRQQGRRCAVLCRAELGCAGAQGMSSVCYVVVVLGMLVQRLC